MSGMWRSRWAAVGAAVAITLGAGGLGIANATTSSGEKPIYKPITPCRLADTRPAPDNVGPRTSPLGPEEAYTLTGWGTVGNCTLPNGTAGLALNVTAVAPSQETYLTIYPTGVTLPLTSNLNPAPGQPPTPNAVNVDLNASGQFNVYNKYGSVHVVVDVVGYYDDHNHDDRYVQPDSLPFTVVSEAGNALEIPDPPTTFQSVTVTAPVAGQLVLTSQESVQMISAVQGDFVTCKILGSTESDGLFGILDEDVQFLQAQASGVLAGTMSGSRVVDIGAGETQTYNLRCQDAGASGKLIYHRKLVAMFTPTP